MKLEYFTTTDNTIINHHKIIEVDDSLSSKEIEQIIMDEILSHIYFSYHEIH